MKRTKSQERILDKIKAKYHDVVIYETKCSLIVKFTNGDDNIWNRINAMVQIGKRGAVKFLMCDRVLADTKHKKVLAKLIAHELYLRRITFSTHFD